MEKIHINQSKELLDFINSSNPNILELQKHMDFSIKNNIQSTIFTIHISNLSIISAIYDKDYTDNIINNLTNAIREKFQNLKLVYSLWKDYLIVFFDCDISSVAIEALQLYNFIQLFGSEATLRPFHLKSLISSINIPNDTICAKDAIKKTYDLLRNISDSDNHFLYQYSELDNSLKIHHRKLISAHSLKNAILEKKIRFAFQPIINSRTGKVAHYESLLRIINNEGKIISAGPFIQIAEEMGFVSLIDNLVLEMVIEELKNHPDVNLAFNLSALGISDKKWLEKFKNLLLGNDLASRLIVEITETALQKDMSKSTYFIETLQDIGCQVALDDFGAGYTSFRQLQTLPIDIIKIDGSFIRDIAESSHNLLFVKSLVNMSKSLGSKSVAEFVENGKIAKALIELQVDYMQGNYFCPAVNYRSWQNIEY